MVQQCERMIVKVFGEDGYEYVDEKENSLRQKKPQGTLFTVTTCPTDGQVALFIRGFLSYPLNAQMMTTKEMITQKHKGTILTWI